MPNENEPKDPKTPIEGELDDDALDAVVGGTFQKHGVVPPPPGFDKLEQIEQVVKPKPQGSK